MPSLKMLLMAGVLCVAPSLSFAAEPTAFTDAQKKEIEGIIREMITKKEPDMIIKAAQNVQERMEKEAATKGQAAVSKNMDKLINDPNAPVLGNPKGDVTVVEFFDYTCGYCKMAEEHLRQLVAEDKNIRLVSKHLPILGPNSNVTAKASLASVAQGKFPQFHEKLMKSKEQLNESNVLAIAKDVGLDTDKLKKDMESEKVQKIIKDNLELAKELGTNGTPTFVIGDKLYSGAIPLEQMKAAVDEARKAKKK